jgi:hypothetical protein
LKDSFVIEALQKIKSIIADPHLKKSETINQLMTLETLTCPASQSLSTIAHIDNLNVAVALTNLIKTKPCDKVLSFKVIFFHALIPLPLSPGCHEICA